MEKKNGKLKVEMNTVKVSDAEVIENPKGLETPDQSEADQILNEGFKLISAVVRGSVLITITDVEKDGVMMSQIATRVGNIDKESLKSLLYKLAEGL